MIIELSKPATTGKFVRPSKLNTFIVDNSGSMYYAMSQLITDTKKRVRDLPVGDAVLIGWFSSPGQFQWIAARELSSEADFAYVEKEIEKGFYARGATCFSDILADTPQAMKPFLSKFQVVTLTFMSDGYHNSGSRAQIFTALSTIKPYLTSSVMVAYGDYSDRALMSEMAQTVGGEVTTVRTIAEVGEAFAKQSGSKAAAKRKVKAKKTKLVFSVEGDSVTVLQPVDGEVLVSDSASVYSYDGLPTTPKEVPTNSVGNVYAAGLALLNMGEIEEATKLMSSLGDVAIVQAIDSAITNAELAQAEARLRKAIINEDAQFTAGRKVGCMPAADAFDLIDLFDLLRNDSKCKFNPYHPEFNYKRTGRGSKVKEGYPKFKPDNIAVPLNKLVGHGTELNLSASLNIPGYIELPDEVDGVRREDIGLPKQYRTNIFRSYSFINNALPTVTTLPIEVNLKLVRQLTEKGVTVKNTGEAGVVSIDLTTIPSCNKARGQKATDWEGLCRNAIKSLELGSMLKVYKAKRDELDPEGEAQKLADLTPEQAKFLEACGVSTKTNVFNPPTESEDPTDVMDVRVFEIKVAKSSSVSVKDFKEMLDPAGKKKINVVGGLMKKAHDEIEASMPKTKGAAVAWLTEKIEALTFAKRELDADTSARRYAVALGGHWMKHFKEDEASFSVDGFDVTLSFRTLQKKI